MKPIFRMSEAGRCPRALSAQLLELEAEPTPAYLELAANEGKWHEERIKSQLATQGGDVFDEQIEVKLDYPTFSLVGHIDGKYNNIVDRNIKLLEIKSMSQFEFDRWMRDGFKGFPAYASQVTCYMEATGLRECLYIVKNRSSGYEDRRVLTEKPHNINEIIEQLFGVVESTQRWSELVTTDFDPQSLECRRCEYKHLCVPEVKELTPVEEAGLSASAEDWRAGKALIERGEYLVDKAKTVFEEHTKATNILRWRHSNLAIQLVHYKEQKTYPKANLLKVFTEKQLEPTCKMKEAYDQLRIDDLNKEDNNG